MGKRVRTLPTSRISGRKMRMPEAVSARTLPQRSRTPTDPGTVSAGSTSICTQQRSDTGSELDTEPLRYWVRILHRTTNNSGQTLGQNSSQNHLRQILGQNSSQNHQQQRSDTGTELFTEPLTSETGSELFTTTYNSDQTLGQNSSQNHLPTHPPTHFPYHYTPTTHSPYHYT